MEERLEKAHLQEILIPIHSFNWYTYKEEIVVNGKLFDVESYRIQNDTVILRGLFDEEETRLYSEVSKWVEQHQKHNPSAATTIAKLIFQVLHNERSSYVVLSIRATIQNYSSTYNPGQLSSAYLTKTSPPPEKC